MLILPAVRERWRAASGLRIAFEARGCSADVENAYESPAMSDEEIG